MALPNPTEWATPVFIVLILMEIIYSRATRKTRYEPSDTLTSLIMGVGSTISAGLLAFITLGAYYFAWDHRIFSFEPVWWLFILAFILDDLAYYVFHRAAHRVRWFWASHVIHHSSQHYNLSTALRQTWTTPFSAGFIFRLPILFFGIPPEVLLFVVGINLVYQFWIHTEAIDRMGVFEWIMNTPSHHRVHHATNPRYLDANYAGVFIIWDRMFGTFVEERRDEPPHYGIVQNLGTFNPLRVAFHEWIALFKDLGKSRSAGEIFGYLLRQPGWTPDGSRLTTDMIKAAWHQEQDPGEMPSG